MAEVERLYGIVHGASKYDFLPAELLVGPSREIMHDLLTLPEGTRVGIEYCPEFNEPAEVDGLNITFDKPSTFYWGRIQKLCQRRNLDIVYLDNFSYYEAIIRRKIRMASLATDVDILSENNLPTNDIKTEVYKLGILNEYDMVINREQGMLQRIQETQPRVGIVGRGHSEAFMSDQTGLQYKGITIHNFLAEDIAIDFEDLDIEKKYHRAFLQSNPKHDKDLALYRRLLTRKYHAVTEGRIIPDRVPDYIGTWDVDISPRGLFEIYLEKNGYKGVIEDCLGTASFDGFIREDYIDFFKVYDLSRSSQYADNAPIHYDGEFEGDEGKGIFQSFPHDREFTLKKFSQ